MKIVIYISAIIVGAEFLLLFILALAKESSFANNSIIHSAETTNRPKKHLEFNLIAKIRKYSITVTLISLIIILIAGISITALKPYSLCKKAKNSQTNGNCTRALVYFRQAIKLNPEYAPAYCTFKRKGYGQESFVYESGIASCYYTLGEYAKAKQAYKKAIELYKKDKDMGKVKMIEKILKAIP